MLISVSYPFSFASGEETVGEFSGSSVQEGHTQDSCLLPARSYTAYHLVIAPVSLGSDYLLTLGLLDQTANWLGAETGHSPL